MDKRTRAEGTVHLDGMRLHDSEDTIEKGMSSDAAAADEAETMASTGDSENSFQEIAAGTATGWGIDRGESAGTGGLAAGEDLDEVAERRLLETELPPPSVLRAGRYVRALRAGLPVRLAERARNGLRGP